MVERSNSQFLAASVNEFMIFCSFGCEAVLNLTTSKGVTTVNLNCTLRNPGAPFSSPTPSPLYRQPYPSQQPCHCRPSERKRNNQRAARHQAAKATTSAPASSSSLQTTVSAATSILTSTVPVTSSPTPASIVKTVSVSLASTAPVVSTSSQKAACDALTCDLCGFEGVSVNDLKIHKSRKNQEIPQLDWKFSTVRNTEIWWEDH